MAGINEEELRALTSLEDFICFGCLVKWKYYLWSMQIGNSGHYIDVVTCSV